MGYVVIGLIFVVILLPGIIKQIGIRARIWQTLSDAASKPFVCPNCGSRFYAPKGKLVFMGEDKALLKCPQCKKTSLCSRPYDLEE